MHAQFIDQYYHAYTEVPVSISPDGGVYSVVNLEDFNPHLTYAFLLNYPNSNPGFVSLSSLIAGQRNNYTLGCVAEKKGADKKTTLLIASINDPLTAIPIRIYPNPATNQVNIDLPGVMLYSIEVYSLVGQKMYSNKTSESFIINTLNFDNGIYIIKIIDQGGEMIKTSRITILR